MLLTVAFAASTVLGLVSPPSAAGAGVSERIPVRVGTYNIHVRTTPAEFSAAVGGLLPLVDVAGLQEVNSKDKESVLSSLRHQGWNYFRYRTRTIRSQEPVLWRTSMFEFLSGKVRLLSGRTFVGDEMPGGEAVILPKYATVVHLRERRTGALISVVNVHLKAGAIGGGRPWPGRPRLFRLYRREMTRVARITQREREWGRVFVLGDFNAGWVADRRERLRRLPFATFRRQGMVSMWATERPSGVGTRNDALIDQVYARRPARSATVALDVLGSDHYPAIAEYVVRPAADQ